jgi:hypothetical protein
MTDLTDLRAHARALIGDVSGSSWDNTVLDNCLRASLGRYAAAVENLATRCIQLVGSGLFGLSLENWGSAPALQEVAYLHWPAESTVAATTGENKLIDWWYYKTYTGTTEKILFDCQVEGATMPAANEYILVSGVVRSLLEGLDSAAVSSVPDTHFHILTLGAAAYALRSKEGQINVASSASTYATAYHVGLLAEMANDFNLEFEKELEIIRHKRLERPPWGIAERKRMRRVAGKP